MKLLLDENLPHTLVPSLQGMFPESCHIRDVGLKGCSDQKIWEYAKQEGFVIVSKDSDFNERAVLMGSPPRVIWLRVGNCSRKVLESLLLGNEKTIRAFEINPDETVLEL